MEHREITKKEFEAKHKGATGIEKEIYDIVAPMGTIFCYCNREAIIEKVVEMVQDAYNVGYGCGVSVGAAGSPY